MRSIDSADLSTRARIRDHAIMVFGELGFGAGVRAVATAAGVSPGLVNHHFGSKEGLRSACDDQVLSIIRDRKRQSLAAPGPAGMLTELAEVADYAPLVAYLVRSFEAGGQLADSLLEHMISDAVGYLREGVATGKLKPSRDLPARARYLTLLNVGAMVLYLRLRAGRTESLDYREAIRELSAELAFPAVELYTDGLLTDSSMLEHLLHQRKEQ